MKPEQQRIAIAEACGWNGPYTPHHFGTLLGTKWIDGAVHQRVPDYLTDLNAMHEAEKVLESKDITGISRMSKELLRVMRLPPEHIWEIFHATTAERAEAFLRTLNLWTDTGPTQNKNKKTT